MACEDLRAALGDLPGGWTGHFFDAVGSTQDAARAAAQRGAAHRSIFVADYQRAGRGRQGRPWLAAPGTALLLSLLFRETDPTPWPLRWTMLASVSLVAAIERCCPSLSPAIKWPNDVLLRGRKVAGVLAETAWDGEQSTAIVGVGLNVSASAADLAAVGSPATSLSVEAGREVARAEVLWSFVRVVDGWLEQPVADLRAAWEARLWGRGQCVRLVESNVDEQQVVVLGVAADGALRVRLADGRERRTTTGELIL